MLYMIIERFREEGATGVHRRSRDQGRLAPEGVEYVSSWVDADYQRCYQVMETDDPAVLEQWMGHRNDLVDFEVIPVMTSAQATAGIADRL